MEAPWPWIPGRRSEGQQGVTLECSVQGEIQSLLHQCQRRCMRLLCVGAGRKPFRYFNFHLQTTLPNHVVTLNPLIPLACGVFIFSMNMQVDGRAMAVILIIVEMFNSVGISFYLLPIYGMFCVDETFSEGFLVVCYSTPALEHFRRGCLHSTLLVLWWVCCAVVRKRFRGWELFFVVLWDNPLKSKFSVELLRKGATSLWHIRKKTVYLPLVKELVQVSRQLHQINNTTTCLCIPVNY